MAAELPEPFASEIERGLHEARGYFGDRLAAVYVRGSLHRGEAVPGVSDIDALLLVEDAPTPADEAWRREANGRLQAQSPLNRWGWLPLAQSASRVTDGGPAARAWVYLLRYDATLLAGRDIAAGSPIPPPDAVWAAGAFEAPWDVARHAAGLPGGPGHEENVAIFPLPADPARRLRKLARLAVLGGAYLRIAAGERPTYRGAEVLPWLNERLPDWAPFLAETERLYVPLTPAATEANAADYAARLAGWMDEIGARLSDLSAGQAPRQ
jgi:hypothetical protein